MTVNSNIVSRFLDTVGDGTGTNSAIADSSGAPVSFKIKPGPDEVYFITRLIVTVEDAGGGSAAEYGNLGGALANGVQVRHSNGDGVVEWLTDPAYPVRTNATWGSYCYDVSMKTWGAGNDLLLVRWTFEKAGHPMILADGDGDFLEVVVNDDLTGLVDHRFLAQGIRQPVTSGTRVRP